MRSEKVVEILRRFLFPGQVVRVRNVSQHVPGQGHLEGRTGIVVNCAEGYPDRAGLFRVRRSIRTVGAWVINPVGTCF